MKLFFSVLLVLTLSFTATSCNLSHECSFGEWTTVIEPTVTKVGQSKRTCKCGESETKDIPAIGISTVKNSLKGKWKCDAEYVYVRFTGDRFVAGLLVGGKESDLLKYTGTYSITDTTITLTEDSGNTFDVMTFTITDSVIEFRSSSGGLYTKY